MTPGLGDIVLILLCVFRRNGVKCSSDFTQASDSSQTRASAVISGAFPGHGLSSSAAITPNRTAQRKHRSTV